jgi:hypothetical protein
MSKNITCQKTSLIHLLIISFRQQMAQFTPVAGRKSVHCFACFDKIKKSVEKMLLYIFGYIGSIFFFFRGIIYVA